MKHSLIVLALLSATAPALAADTAATAAVSTAKPAFSTADSDIGTLIDNPVTKAVLMKYMAELVSSPQIDMARAMTLRQIQGYAPDKITDDMLGKIDADLAAVPAPK